MNQTQPVKLQADLPVAETENVPLFRLELTPEQRKALTEVLDEYLSDLRFEIADTEQYDFKDRLRHYKHTLDEIVAALQDNETGTNRS